MICGCTKNYRKSPQSQGFCEKSSRTPRKLGPGTALPFVYINPCPASQSVACWHTFGGRWGFRRAAFKRWQVRGTDCHALRGAGNECCVCKGGGLWGPGFRNPPDSADSTHHRSRCPVTLHGGFPPRRARPVLTATMAGITLFPAIFLVSIARLWSPNGASLSPDLSTYWPDRRLQRIRPGATDHIARSDRQS